MKKPDLIQKDSSKNSDNSMSKEYSIFILASLLCVLMIYLFSTKIINEKRLEISDYYTVFSTEITEEITEKPEIMININTDNIFELTLIPGIGTSKAKAILDYRKENGDFQNIEEIMNVAGIGESTFNKLKAYIYVQENSQIK